MKVFHKSFITSTLCCVAFTFAAPCGFSASEIGQDTASHYDPVAGFRPAQRDFTNIVLQLAGSLEHHGTPAPYLRHIMAEHERISAKYERLVGKPAPQMCPEYMTEDYLDRLETNWDVLAEKLDLDVLARRSGENLRRALPGKEGSGTFFVDILNTHQRRVFQVMTSEGSSSATFDDLLAVLRLEIEEPDSVRYMIERETELDEGERDALAGLLRKEHFTKADFAALEEFYENSQHKLTQAGQKELSARLWRGMDDGEQGASVAGLSQQEALGHAQAFLREFETLFAKLDAALPADDAEKLKNALTSVFIDLGRMAHSELEAGILEWALDQKNSAASPLAGG